MQAITEADALACLQLQSAFGADEAIDDAPIDRRRTTVAPAAARPAALAGAMPDAARSIAPVARQAAPPRPVSALEAARAEAAAASSIEDLRRRLAGFTLCPLAVTATRAAIADGNQAAGIVLVGDVPGEAEDRSGRPFDGEAGALLDRMLGAIALDRTRVCLLNTIPWRPPGGRAPNPGEIALCEPFLRRHLALLQPRLIVALGTLPARILTGETGTIRKLRGTWHEVSLDGIAAPVKLLATYHPAFLLDTPAAKRDAWTDLQSIRDYVATFSSQKIEP